MPLGMLHFGLFLQLEILFRVQEQATMAEQPQTIYRKDYKATPYLVDFVNLDFNLNEDVTRVVATLSIQQNNGGTCVRYHTALTNPSIEQIASFSRGNLFLIFEACLDMRVFTHVIACASTLCWRTTSTAPLRMFLSMH